MNNLKSMKIRKSKSFLFIFAMVFVLLFCLVFWAGFVSADVLSLNSGGSDNLVVNPDNYIEGFFSGLPQELIPPPVCGNHVIETGEQCDDGNTVSGDGCSSTCQIEEGPGPGPEPGPTGPTIIPKLFEFSPTEINLNLLTNTNREQLIVISSVSNYTINVTLGQSNLDHMLILTETQVTLEPGEVKEIRAIFVALNQTGIFTGKIYVGNKVLPVTLNIKTKLLLFDSNIIVLNKDYLVRQGDKLRTSVTLIPMGDPERLDVTLNYVIKDYDGRLYLTRSETVLVEEQVNFRRNFDTGILPLGEYIIGLELIYPNGVAPSSAHFEVIEKGPTTLFGKIVFFIINAILIVIILLIIVIIIRLFKRMKENKEYEKKYGKVPKKERKILFFDKGDVKHLPITRKRDEIKSKSKEKPSKEISKVESKSDSTIKTDTLSSTPPSSEPIDIGSFSFKKKGKKT